MEIDFSSVWGQEAACNALSLNIKNDRVASAYLLSGPQGIGKTKTAMIFARSLLCESDASRPCGACGSCKMMEKEAHPDFTKISPDGTMIKIGQMRELFSKLSFKSYGGGRKVCVVEEAEKMNGVTVNAFLKTLEEPPPDTALILVSSNPSALLPTIISRCRLVRFVPMQEEKLSRLLIENGAAQPEEALRIARLAEGCPGRVLSDGIDRIKAIDDEAADILSRLLDIKPGELIGWAEGWKTRRDDLPLLIDRLMDLLRLAGQGSYLNASDTMSDVMHILGETPVERLVEGFDALLAVKPDLRFNPNIQLFLESNLLNLQSILKEGVGIAD